MDYSGNYPLETRAAEIERLQIQSEAMAPEARAMLGRIGVAEGWRCLDMGCGPAGVAGLVSPAVGDSGYVLGLDRDESFLDAARSLGLRNAEFKLGDIYDSGLPGDEFDLVHLRFVASTAGQPERLLREAIRLTRPGGYVALQEPDGETLNCDPPHPAWDRLKAALLGSFAGSGADLRLARRLYSLAFQAGLVDVQYRTFLIAVRGGDPLTDYLPSTVESLRAAAIRLGLLPAGEFDQVVADCRRHLSGPGVSFTMYAVAQVWGRKRI